MIFRVRGVSPRCDDQAAQESVWIVVPAFNEEKRIGQTLDDLCSQYASVVVVDDGSDDDTPLVATQYPVWYLRHLVNCGQGAALQTGIEFALDNDAKIIVTFDADGQHRVEDIQRLVQPIQRGWTDVTLGSRFLGETSGMPWTRWFLLKLAVIFTRVVSSLRVTDAHNGLRAFSRTAAQRIRVKQHGMAHASEILDQVHHHKLRYCETPVTIHYDRETLEKGQSSWNSVRIASQLLLGRFVG